MNSWAIVLAVVVFVVVLAAIQVWYIRTGQPTISARIQGFHRIFPAIGFLAGFAAGWFGAHWFDP